MRYASEPSAEGSRGVPTFDPAGVFDRFGTRFAILATPDVTHRFVAQLSSEEAPGAPLRPVSVTVRYQIGDAVVDVMTRRGGADDQTLSDHLRGAATDLLLAGSDAVPPDELPAWAQNVALRPAPVEAGSRAGLLDGVAATWRAIHDQGLVACGVEIGDLMIAVVADAEVIDTPAVILWPSTA